MPDHRGSYNPSEISSTIWNRVVINGIFTLHVFGCFSSYGPVRTWKAYVPELDYVAHLSMCLLNYTRSRSNTHSVCAPTTTILLPQRVPSMAWTTSATYRNIEKPLTYSCISCIYWRFYKFRFAQSAGAVEYTDCFSARPPTSNECPENDVKQSNGEVPVKIIGPLSKRCVNIGQCTRVCVCVCVCVCEWMNDKVKVGLFLPSCNYFKENILIMYKSSIFESLDNFSRISIINHII